MSSIELTSASAGSGKTTRLIGRLGEILLTVSPDSVVAITFTNAAVREIRERIGDAGDLAICTIHSFFASILKEQALNIGISPLFDILDENESAYIFKEITKKTILKNVSASVYRNILADYGMDNLVSIMLKMENRYSLVKRNIGLSFRDFLEIERNAEHELLISIMGDNFIDGVVDVLLNSSCRSEDNSLERERRSLLPYLSELRPLAVRYNRDSTDREIFRQLSDLLKETKKIKSVRNRKSIKGWAGEEEMTAVQNAMLRLNDIIDQVKKLNLGDDSVSETAARYEESVVELFNDIHSEFAKTKQQLEALDYNDIEIMTHDLIFSRPDIAASYRSRYKYILVDEYQDTNSMQRDILLKLSDNFYFVGDAKQSIYRFRNADVSVFIETEKSLLNKKSDELRRNYRSLKNIVGFVNRSFGILFNEMVENRREFDPEYKDMAFDRKESDGRVEILNVGPEGVTSSDVEREALCAVNLIRDGLLSGRHPADYAILFRTKLHMGLFEKKLRECGIPCRVLGKSKRDDALTMVKNTVYAAINPYRNYYLFFLCRLPFFYIEDSTVYYFIRRFGSFWEGIRSYNPEANPAKISENELQSLERLKDYLNIAACRQNELGLSEFIIWLLKKGGIISSVAMLYPGQEQGLEEFIVNLLNKVEQNGYDIRKFLDYLDDAEVSSDKNCSADAVRIMTVHSSKGLQSPVVILPCLFNEPNFNDWLVVSSAGQISIKIQTEGQRAKVNTALYTRIKEYEYCAELAESKRLFYVAMTRARDELFFIGNFNSCSGRARWMDWLSVVAGGDIKKAGPDDTAVLKERYKPCRYVVNVDHSETCSCFITQRAHRIRSTVSMIRNFVREKSRSDGETQYKNLGDTVHLILEKLNDRESVSLILDNLPSVYRQHAIKLIDEFCDSDIGQRIFKSTDVYFNEYPFIVNIDGMIVNGRIDRINIYDDKAWIIDYKTGIEPAAMESYKIQLAVYLRVAGLMFPDKIVSGSLVDVSECKEYLYTAGELETGLADLGNDLKGQ